jgi:hypothetical protein
LGESRFKGASPGKNIHDTPISTNKKLGMVVRVCHPKHKLAIKVLAGPDINARPRAKNT